MKPCPCNPENDFDQCCGPYLAGTQQAPTPEALMRSRYTAHVLEDYPYVLRTCHHSTRPPEDEFDDAEPVDWCGLEIISSDGGLEKDERGNVEFVASYNVSGSIQRMHEKSRFVKEEGQWFYLEGDLVPPPQAKSAKVGRNEPCPCGSGKKYKKCCYR